jgi:hypothetical protein
MLFSVLVFKVTFKDSLKATIIKVEVINLATIIKVKAINLALSLSIF